MKYFFGLALSLAATSLCLGQARVTVVADGSRVMFPDVQPVFFGDRVLVPLRTVFEVFQAKVDWDGKARQVTITGKSKTIVLRLGEPKAVVNGENMVMDTTPKLVQGRVVVPLRFLAESLDSGVVWRPDERLITITPHR